MKEHEIKKIIHAQNMANAQELLNSAEAGTVVHIVSGSLKRSDQEEFSLLSQFARSKGCGLSCDEWDFVANK